MAAPDETSDNPARAARREKFAKIVAAAEAAVADAAEDRMPSLDDVTPESDVLRQADLLDALRPRAVRESGGSGAAGREPSSLAGLREKAYSAAMGVAKPLRDELERILDYLDAVSAAYRVAAERIDALEAELARLREGPDPGD